MDFEVVQFDRAFDARSFRCGKPSLDEWLARYAGQSERRLTTRTFLAVASGNEVIGYYATTVCELDLDAAAAAFGVGKRRYPVPAVLLARLAVSIEHQGRGVGGRLLVDALRRLTAAASSVGFEVVVVDALDAEASTFYRRFGFRLFEDDELHLFLTTKDLVATFDTS